jgi:transketolase
VAAWKYAIEDKRPVALLLSRQNIKDLPGDRKIESAKLTRGAYVVADAAGPDVVMIANGSEVATLVEGAELLAREGIRARIVSVPSEGIFRGQSEEYQREILPAGIPRYGLTSGLPVTLAALVGENGYIHGLNHFGFSAPYKVLDDKFGFSGAHVAADVKKLLKR